MGDPKPEGASIALGVPANGTAPSTRKPFHAASLDPYWVVAAVLVVLLVTQTLNRRWGDDFWLHKATIDTFRRSLMDPVHPMTGTHVPFEYYTPYTFALAAFGRVTGWSSVSVLQLAAVFNLALFLVGFRLFVGQLTNRLAVAFSLVATLIFWGWHPWRWSGFLDLNSIGFTLPYPSMFATGLAFVVAWALLRYATTRSAPWLVVVALGLPTVMLSHPITGVWVAILLVALVVSRGLYRGAALARLVAVLVVVAAILAVWPYYPFFQLIRDQHHAEPAIFYSGVPLRWCASLVGLVALVRRLRRDRTDPLVLMFLGGALVYAFGAVTANYSYGRVLPLVLLPLHIGIGELIATSVERPERNSPAVLAWLTLSAVVGFAGILPAFASTTPRALLPDSMKNRAELQPITSHYGALDHAFPPGSVIVVETSAMEEPVVGHGLHPLSVEGADAFVPDADERNAASREILDPKTSGARRRELILKYRVAGALCEDQTCNRLFTGSRLRVEGFTLVRFGI